MQRQMSFVDCSYPKVISQYAAWSNLYRISHIVARFWLPQANILRSQANNVAFVVNDACTSTASANVNAQCQRPVWIELVVAGISSVSYQASRVPARKNLRISAHLAGLLPIWLSVGKLRHFEKLAERSLGKCAEVSRTVNRCNRRDRGVGQTSPGDQIIFNLWPGTPRTLDRAGQLLP